MKPWHWLFLIGVCACAADPSDPSTVSEESHGGSAVFPPGAHPFGHSMAHWSERWWRWIFRIPADTNPIFDLTGEDCAVGQRNEDVWFLASVVDPGGAATFTRSCTIPSEKAILISPSGILNDFPCPDPSFHPAPGQSLYDFLRIGAEGVVDAVNGLTVTLDGRAVADPFDFRVVSPRLFDITGDPSLATSLDGCIIGSPQPAVSDGFFLMLKPLSRGAHTLVIRATDTRGTDVTITWNLTVARDR